MTDQQKIAFKNELKQLCCSIIRHRIEAAKLAIDNAQQAANNEQKSSAGDKHETSRAMSHLEKEMHARQLSENVRELGTLSFINVDLIYEVVTSGAFLQCTGVSFFIAAGLGKQIVGGKSIFFLSPHAPLAKLIENKKAGDSFLFKESRTEIISIF